MLENLCPTFCARFPQQCPVLPRPRPGAPTRPLSHTHPLSAYLQQHGARPLAPGMPSPKVGMSGILAETCEINAFEQAKSTSTNTPARFTHLEGALTFIRGIFPDANLRVSQRQPGAGAGNGRPAAVEGLDLFAEWKYSREHFSLPCASGAGPAQATSEPGSCCPGKFDLVGSFRGNDF